MTKLTIEQGDLTRDLARYQNSPFYPALRFLSEVPVEEIDVGRYDIDGDKIFALVSSYPSKSPAECKFESHKDYIDIQCLLKGKERIGIAPSSELEVSEPYDKSRDLIFYKTPQNFEWEPMTPGKFVMFYPKDGHMPNCNYGEPEDVLKVVIKFSVAEFEKGK